MPNYNSHVVNIFQEAMLPVGLLALLLVCVSLARIVNCTAAVACVGNNATACDLAKVRSDRRRFFNINVLLRFAFFATTPVGRASMRQNAAHKETTCFTFVPQTGVACKNHYLFTLLTKYQSAGSRKADQRRNNWRKHFYARSCCNVHRCTCLLSTRECSYV